MVAAVAAVVAAAVVAAAAVTDMICDNHNRLLMQFHITGRCNLRCKHCYRTEGDVEPLSTEDVKEVITQFLQLQKAYNSLHGIRKKAHINITGGEPLIREDIDEILRFIGMHSQNLSYGILSNGSFLDARLIGVLKETGVSFVQLSLDGDRQTHDSLRAPGDYDRVLETAQMLENQGIRTYISFTANRENYRHLPQVARQCRKRGITKLWSDRLVPIGTGEVLSELAITEEILPDYVKTLKKAQGNFLTRLCYPKTRVTMNRALQFLYSKGEVYSCSAGDSLITVDEFGSIMPCRRMPIACGNVHDNTLEDIYFHHETFRNLRVFTVPQGCRKCKYQILCKGGARCQSYSAYHSFYRADPACPEKTGETY